LMVMLDLDRFIHLLFIFATLPAVPRCLGRVAACTNCFPIHGIVNYE